MKKKIYLHIGYHKTGTTAIQTTLFDHQRLLEKQGYYYPTSSISSIAHHNIAWELQSHQKFNVSDGSLQQLILEIDQTTSSSIIISSEEFSRLTHNQIQKLAQAFMKYNVTIIVYLRRQDQLLQSIWAQTVKDGKQKRSFDAWLEKSVFKYIGDDPIYKNARHKLNYALATKEWAEAFGENNIRVRVYDKSIKNILKDFLTACDMQDTSWVPDPARNNVSPSIKTLETIRLISNSLNSLPKNVKHDTTYVTLFQSIRDQANALGWNTEKLNLITPEIYSQIMEPLTESNNQVAQKYLGRDTLFVDDSVPDAASSFDIESLNAKELLEVFSPALEGIIYQASNVSRSDMIKQQIIVLSHKLPKISNLISRYPRLSNYLKTIIRRFS